MTEEPKGPTCSAYTDTELRDWLRSTDQQGSGFLQVIAEAALVADLRSYKLLRPVLLELKKEGSGRV